MLQGHFRRGALEGKGFVCNADDSMLTSTFVKGEAQGKGKYEFMNGLVYEGEFRNGKMYGDGQLTFTPEEGGSQADAFVFKGTMSPIASPSTGHDGGCGATRWDAERSSMWRWGVEHQWAQVHGVLRGGWARRELGGVGTGREEADSKQRQDHHVRQGPTDGCVCALQASSERVQGGRAGARGARG
eukprot:9874-Rhodomonas_salina.4